MKISKGQLLTVRVCILTSSVVVIFNSTLHQQVSINYTNVVNILCLIPELQRVILTQSHCTVYINVYSLMSYYSSRLWDNKINIVLVYNYDNINKYYILLHFYCAYLFHTYSSISKRLSSLYLCQGRNTQCISLLWSD